MFLVCDAWRAAYPGACAGILAMTDVQNPPQHEELNRRKGDLEARLRERFAGTDRSTVGSIPVIQAYNAYYRRFKKSYHVQFQIESIAFRGKSLPRVASLVEAMFMAELGNMCLTAGHDLQAIRGSVRLDVATGEEHYVLLNGQEKQLKRSDMMMCDDEGVISSVIYGPDHRTQITAFTQEALFAVYAPPGIGEDAVRHHLDDIRTNVLLVAPGAEVRSLEVHAA
jgi:DNA/RNA-binding domain of Phe-tRNA-synthetase-like protein